MSTAAPKQPQSADNRAGYDQSAGLRAAVEILLVTVVYGHITTAALIEARHREVVQLTDHGIAVTKLYFNRAAMYTEHAISMSKMFSEHAEGMCRREAEHAIGIAKHAINIVEHTNAAWERRDDLIVMKLKYVVYFVGASVVFTLILVLVIALMIVYHVHEVVGVVVIGY
ncbi:hypothetical protein B0H63DRAFT_105556 [Podospora didyma]|uniref:Uncharacterized protein n=1 Tax=Podospora didyma TaxID=330526 RepID=A0AAE0NYD7_9PEZI|nr:hypothetical protein B0H63DRAFT_105556 [Podospora didyma]